MNKILLLGHARHGKDTVADMMFRHFGLRSIPSSGIANRLFIFDRLKDKYGYQTLEECFEDRVNHRGEWYDLICEYNREDRTRLAQAILQEADIYTGIRDNAELQACKKAGMFRWIIGVYDPRKPLEPITSLNIDIWAECNLVLNNGSSLEDLDRRVLGLSPLLK